MSSVLVDRVVVDVSVDDDPVDFSDAGIAAELITLRVHLDRLEARFARFAVAGHQRGIGAADGSPSTAAWLRRHTGMREGDARAAIEAGAMCEVLAETGVAWRGGEISSGAARVIAGARVEGHDAKLRAVEPLLLDVAREGKLRELQRMCARFRNCAQADGTEPRDHDGLTISATAAGRTILNGNLSSAAAETVVNALHALTDPPTPDDRRTAARRRADALVRMAELAMAQLSAAGPDGPSRAKPSVTMVLDWRTLVNDEFGRMDGEYTGPVHRSDVERLLCDSSVTRVVTGPRGLPIDVGRERRTVSSTLRKALIVRDRGCRFPECGWPPGWCDAHHLQFWRHGGPTDRSNLVFMCDHHHDVLHQPGWTAAFDGVEFRVFKPDGSEVT